MEEEEGITIYLVRSPCPRSSERLRICAFPISRPNGQGWMGNSEGEATPSARDDYRVCHY